MEIKISYFIISLVILYFLINKKNIKNIININNFGSIETFISTANFKISNIYVINLDREEDKMRNLHNEMIKNNYKYEKFSAVDGKKLKENDYRIKKYFGKTKNYSMGQKCCTLSHIAIWNKILENKTQYNIILEDDVIIPEKLYSNVNKYLEQLPEDWDFLFLGGNRIIGHKYSENLLVPPKKKVNGNYGTFAYLINSKNIKNILDKCYNILEHTDTFIQRTLSKDFNIFFCNPQVIKHNYDTVSSIRNKNRKNEEKRNNYITVL